MFMQNVLKEDEEEWEMIITSKDVERCPPDLVSNARQAATDRHHNGADDHAITPQSCSLVEPYFHPTPCGMYSTLGRQTGN